MSLLADITKEPQQYQDSIQFLYRTTDVNLEGQMLDGSRYSVPVKYWMPLLSQGGVVTQIRDS